MSEGPSFRPAKPWGWVIWAVQTFLRFDLAWRNRLHLEPRDLDVLRALPPGAGIILAANHADETDFKACLELSRRSGRRFLFMMNRQAFDEGYGVAGWWLQRLGAFSVERGGQHNEEAKRYAIEVVVRGREVLVIFPEGEIYYTRISMVGKWTLIREDNPAFFPVPFDAREGPFWSDRSPAFLVIAGAS